jgi:DnaJ-class molecular chaperone
MAGELDKPVKYKICKHCKGNGYVKGQINAAVCLFCRGSGHDSRMKNSAMKKIIKLTEELILRGKKGSTE